MYKKLDRKFSQQIKTSIDDILCDRRTALTPAVRRQKELEDREEKIERVLKKLAKKDSKVEEVLKHAGLF